MSDELKTIIWQTVAAIPEGKVATYGQVARRCGYPGHARYVGTVLKQLPQASQIPWHRVINSKGQIAFAVGSEAYLQQKSRLEQEGVAFCSFKIDLSQYGWD